MSEEKLTEESIQNEAKSRFPDPEINGHDIYHGGDMAYAKQESFMDGAKYAIAQFQPTEQGKEVTKEFVTEQVRLVVHAEQIRSNTYNLFGPKPFAWHKSFIKNLHKEGIYYTRVKPQPDPHTALIGELDSVANTKDLIDEYEALGLLTGKNLKDIITALSKEFTVIKKRNPNDYCVNCKSQPCVCHLKSMSI